MGDMMSSGMGGKSGGGGGGDSGMGGGPFGGAPFGGGDMGLGGPMAGGGADMLDPGFSSGNALTAGEGMGGGPMGGAPFGGGGGGGTGADPVAQSAQLAGPMTQSAPTGQQSGDTNPIVKQLHDALFGSSAQAATPPSPGAAAEGDTSSGFTAPPTAQTADASTLNLPQMTVRAPPGQSPQANAPRLGGGARPAPPSRFGAGGPPLPPTRPGFEGMTEPQFGGGPPAPQLPGAPVAPVQTEPLPPIRQGPQGDFPGATALGGRNWPGFGTPEISATATAPPIPGVVTSPEPEEIQADTGLNRPDQPPRDPPTPNFMRITPPPAVPAGSYGGGPMEAPGRQAGITENVPIKGDKLPGAAEAVPAQAPSRTDRTSLADTAEQARQEELRRQGRQAAPQAGRTDRTSLADTAEQAKREEERLKKAGVPAKQAKREAKQAAREAAPPAATAAHPEARPEAAPARPPARTNAPAATPAPPAAAGDQFPIFQGAPSGLSAQGLPAASSQNNAPAASAGAARGQPRGFEPMRALGDILTGDWNDLGSMISQLGQPLPWQGKPWQPGYDPKTGKYTPPSDTAAAPAVASAPEKTQSPPVSGKKAPVSEPPVVDPGRVPNARTPMPSLPMPGVSGSQLDPFTAAAPASSLYDPMPATSNFAFPPTGNVAPQAPAAAGSEPIPQREVQTTPEPSSLQGRFKDLGLPSAPTPAPGTAPAAPATGPGASAPQAYPGTSLRHTAANTLAASGMKPNAIAGIMANIGKETDWQTSGPSSTGRAGEKGLVQFSPTGEKPFYNRWRIRNGNAPDTPQNQMRFLAERLQTDYSGTLAKMNSASTPAEAAEIFAREYERPAAKHLNARVNEFRHGVPNVEQQLGQRAESGAQRFNSIADGREVQKTFSGVRTNFSGMRPSQNLEDVRGVDRSPTGNLGGGNWENPIPTYPPPANYDPNNPMTQALTGAINPNNPADIRKLRIDVLRSMNNDEFFEWVRQIRRLPGAAGATQ